MPLVKYRIYELSARAVISYGREQDGVYTFRLSAAETEKCKSLSHPQIAIAARKVSRKTRSGCFNKFFASFCCAKSKPLKKTFNHRSNSSGRIRRAAFLGLRTNGISACAHGTLSFTL